MATFRHVDTATESAAREAFGERGERLRTLRGTGT
jgi:hypothetical protein